MVADKPKRRSTTYQKGVRGAQARAQSEAMRVMAEELQDAKEAKEKARKALQAAVVKRQALKRAYKKLKRENENLRLQLQVTEDTVDWLRSCHRSGMPTPPQAKKRARLLMELRSLTQ